jgi:hypothetical protein
MALKALKEKQMSYPRKEYKPKSKPKQEVTMTSEMIEETSKPIEVVVSKWRFKNFTLPNLVYIIQGYYRAFIIRQYNKLTGIVWKDLPTKIMQCSECLGTNPKCGCPWAELLLSDKPCNCK